MYHLHLRKRSKISGNRGRMKSGMRSSMRGRVTRILHILTTSYYRYLGVNLTSFFFPFLFTLPSTDFSYSFSFFKKKSYNGWGVTLFDSLDTLWIMGLRDEFADAVDGVRDFQFRATRVSQGCHT